MGYADLSSSFVYKQPLFATKLDQLGENDKWLKDNGWHDSTKIAFYQSTSPTGWTQDTGINDRMLRVTSGIGAGNSGTYSPSASLSLSHNHTMAAMGNHVHSTSGHYHDLATTGNVVSFLTNYGYLASDDSGSTDLLLSGFGGGVSRNYREPRIENEIDSIVDSSSAGAHNHTINAAAPSVLFQYEDIILCAKDTSSGYIDLTNSFSHGDKSRWELFSNAASLSENDEYLKARVMPFGSISLFHQASAPTGWTKIVGSNDRFLRVVSGAGGGNGGTTVLSTGLILNHQHSTVAAGAHTHTSGNHRHYNGLIKGSTYTFSATSARHLAANGSNELVPCDGAAVSQTVYERNSDVSGGGVTTSDPGAHNHILSFFNQTYILKYLDVIQASKDSSGASYPYQDLTSSVAFEKLVSKQRLNNFGKNDEYLKFHTIPSGSIMVFHMSSPPTGWTKLTTATDACLRMVSGVGGGSGGSSGVQSGFNLNHNHPIGSTSHSHSFSHSHSLSSNTNSNAGNIQSNRYVGKDASSRMFVGASGSTISRITKNLASASGSSVSLNHDHSTPTSSDLGSYPYLQTDLIRCQKN